MLLSFYNKTMISFNLKNGFVKNKWEMLKFEGRTDKGDSPFNDMGAYIKEHVYPVIGDIHAGINSIKIEQANAEPGCERHERNTGKHVERIESWISSHHILMMPNLAVDINCIFVKFS